MIVLVL